MKLPSEKNWSLAQIYGHRALCLRFLVFRTVLFIIASLLLPLTRPTVSASRKMSGDSVDWGTYIRSPLARTVYYRTQEDQQEQNRDHSFWYAVREEQLTEELCTKFLQCHEDEETKAFLKSCYDKADWLFTQLGHALARAILGWFISQTSLNGILRRGSMFVFSTQQFRDLLSITPEWKARRLLDLGAGDGKVTMKMASHFEEIYTTEASGPMVWRLQELGYKLLDIDQWSNGSMKYDVIGCLNLLDRCDKPASILHQIRNSLVPDSGRAVIAVVLPFHPYVEFGEKNHKPTEFLHISGKTYEEQIISFTKNVFQPAGFQVEKFTRLPYLCEGDMNRSFYVLDDVVFVLKPI